MKINSTSARLRVALCSALAAGLAGAVTLTPSPVLQVAANLPAESASGPQAPGADAGLPRLVAFQAQDPTEPDGDRHDAVACADGGCIDPEAISSQPAAGPTDGGNAEPDDGIPVLASLAPLPAVPGLDDADHSDDPSWQPTGSGGTGGRGQGGGYQGGGQDGDGQARGTGAPAHFAYLPGTGGPGSPAHPGGDAGENGPDGDPGQGAPSGGGTGGSNTGGPMGGFTGGGGTRPGGDGDGDEEDDEGTSVQRLAAIGDAPVDVPAPGTITLLGLGLVALRSRRR